MNRIPITPEPYGPIVLRLPPDVKFTEEQFLELCGLNDELRIEINARGELELMAPTFGSTSNRNIRISARLQLWAEADESRVWPTSPTQVSPCPAVRCAPPMLLGY